LWYWHPKRHNSTNFNNTIVSDESREKCNQYQEEINKLQKEIEDYKKNLEVKENLVNESRNRRVQYITNYFLTVKYDLILCCSYTC